MEVLYEDNHLLAVSKSPGEIVQGDRTGDEPLVETCKAYIKEKYNKPGAVFLGVVHRLDRPVSGVVLFARTSKALTRLNDAFRRRDDLEKIYFALVEVARSALLRPLHTLSFAIEIRIRATRSLRGQRRQRRRCLNIRRWLSLPRGRHFWRSTSIPDGITRSVPSWQP